MLEFFSEMFGTFGEALKTVLPTSPFRDFIDSVAGIPYLGYLNWFVPVGDILVVMGVWLAAITLFHIYSIVMRWLKVIGD